MHYYFRELVLNARSLYLAGLIGIGLLLGACQTETQQSQTATRASSDTVRVKEAFVTPRDTSDNVDSPAIWHGPDGQHWLLATAKEGDVIRVHDAATGKPLQRVGESGTGIGQLDRPNGIAVIDDLMLIVERNNRRVQVFSLPDFESLGTFGEEQFRWPYGLTVYKDGGEYVLYVTDAYEEPDESVPPLEELGERVKQFRFSVEGGTLKTEHVRTFGATSETGALRVVESIWADPENERLLVAEEQEGNSKIKVYTLDGTFTGTVIPATYFPHQAEGIVLYPCGSDGGYWLTTDQGENVNTYHIFDRTSLDYVGSFRGERVKNTDGIAVTQTPFGPFKQGAFYAVHDDGNTVAFDWSAIAQALGLRADCTAQ